MNRPAPLALDTSGGEDCYACVLGRLTSSSLYSCRNRELHDGYDMVLLEPWLLDCARARYREIP